MLIRPVAATGVALAYGACFVAIRAGLQYAPPFAYAGLRAVIAGAALLAFGAVARQPLVATGVSWPALGLIALTSTTLGFGTMFASQPWVGAGIAAVLANLQPLFVVALAVVFFGERLRRTKVAALALGTLGVTFLVSPSLDRETGALLALASSASLAAGNLLLKRLGEPPRVVAFSAWQLVAGALPLLALSAFVEREARFDWTPRFLWTLGLLALAGTALPYLIWNWLIRTDEVGALSIYLFLTPVFGVVLASAIYGERLSASAWLGLTLTLIAAALVARTQVRPWPADRS